ncbi:MAG: lipoyl protein ligase domain-containing protein [Limisphaerales bacterium]
MRETWFLLQSGLGQPAFNMALDETLLEKAPEITQPIFRFYSWTEPAASFCYSQKYFEIERVTTLRPLIRRPTGGGLVPHEADWTYSLIFPPNHSWHNLKAMESYEKVHQWIRDAFAKINIATELSGSGQKEISGQCFIGAEKFDLLWHGKKIAGAAQRRTKNGLLMQGSVQPAPISAVKADWQKAMCDVAQEQFQISWNELVLPVELSNRALQLSREKYAQANFNQKR